MGFFFADNIDHTLKENILLDASYLNKIEEVPTDGDCGAHCTCTTCLIGRRRARSFHNRNTKKK